MSVKSALERYYAKQIKTEAKPRRKNQRPEFEFKKIAKKWLEEKGFSINVVESKAVYSESSGRYISGQTDSGFSDIVGVTPLRGVACYIELKAPGSRARLKEHQRQFLISKIDRFAFAVCTDSIHHLETRYNLWANLYDMGMYMEAKNFLLKDLPKSSLKDTDFLPDKIDTKNP